MDPSVYMRRGYDLGYMVGKGSFGSAMIVRRLKDGAKCVCKEIRLSRLNQKEKTAALREVNVLSTLQHPNIIQYIDHFEENNTLYIIMEYADSGDLGEHIKQQKLKGTPFREDQIMRWFIQVCLALKHLHDKRILHRDLKGGNVFLTSSGVIKLGDFGLSTILTNTVAMARTVCGTPYYFSPELCRNEPYNNKSDVWAVGCLLYELCTLKHAFEGSTMKGLTSQILRGTVAPIPSHYSVDLQRLVVSVLQQDYRRRPSIDSLLAQEFIQQHMVDVRAVMNNRAVLGGGILNPAARLKPEASPILPPQQNQVARQAATNVAAVREALAKQEEDLIRQREAERKQRLRDIEERQRQLQAQAEKARREAYEERIKEQQRMMANWNRADIRTNIRGNAALPIGRRSPPPAFNPVLPKPAILDPLPIKPELPKAEPKMGPKPEIKPEAEYGHTPADQDLRQSVADTISQILDAMAYKGILQQAGAPQPTAAKGRNEVFSDEPPQGLEAIPPMRRQHAKDAQNAKHTTAAAGMAGVAGVGARRGSEPLAVRGGGRVSPVGANLAVDGACGALGAEKRQPEYQPPPPAVEVEDTETFGEPQYENPMFTASLRNFLEGEVGLETLRAACEVLSTTEDEEDIVERVARVLADDDKDLSNLVTQLAVMEQIQKQDRDAM